MQIDFLFRPHATAEKAPRVGSEAVPRPPMSEGAGAQPANTTHGTLSSPRPLNLRLEIDAWNPSAFSGTTGQIGRQQVQIPGRVEPFMQGVRLHHTSPKEIVEGVAALFGAIKHDPCPGARNRLANYPAVSDEMALQDDLQTIERFCQD